MNKIFDHEDMVAARKYLDGIPYPRTPHFIVLDGRMFRVNEETLELTPYDPGEE